ncbi:hypothetical protein H5410_027000 [Solanum commersonii]|uniref:Uncharacterized protein n=1 Tax=Solanum commersonii TaxID=4109 RepID=A0A9J5Z280_SOLCO|nr:hypothetical protein H5410_027000 [Solanum commersonii]
MSVYILYWSFEAIDNSTSAGSGFVVSSLAVKSTKLIRVTMETSKDATSAQERFIFACKFIFSTTCQLSWSLR